MVNKEIENLIGYIAELQNDLKQVTSKLKSLEIRVDGIHKTAINNNMDLNKLGRLIKNFGSNISRDFYND